MKRLTQQLPHYARLIRLHKPIGILLLLWPTLWALWLAGAGHPDKTLIIVFVAGVILMRSAGCIINDIADRHIDGHVMRTRERPLATGAVSLKEALVLFVLLMVAAFLLVLLCNRLTILLAFVGAVLAIIYPFLKRITHLPQLGLGIAFAWGVPMAFAAQTGSVGVAGWWVFAAAMWWPIMYDTLYAMTDREDDIKIGVKSTAILFGEYDKKIIGMMQIGFIVMLDIVGRQFHLSPIYDIFVMIVIGMFLYQQYLIRNRDPQACFKAFLKNNQVGLVVFIGIYLSYLA